MFDDVPSLEEIVGFAWENFRCRGDDEMTLRGRVDCGRAGVPNFAPVNLSSEKNWDQYKKLVGNASIMFEVVVDIGRRTVGIVGRIVEARLVGHMATQESIISQVEFGGRQHDAFEMNETYRDGGVAMAHDDFPNDIFERDEAEMDKDEI
ncbi:hypothetical protein HU200_032964 [Digitaria exilis]|uniref:Uncharacterized protein n=1 Tax=Digitaria exilis TaxID=1010633 RepID=A0A835BMP5_9POAL|nr:hypothetical protein HU200_032964 [Digitaria exilis]